MDANEYQIEAQRTERINWENKHGPDIAILGAIGEVGSLASVVKKHQRDGDAYASFSEHFIEELGDILWYVITVASRLNITINEWPIITNTNSSMFEGIYKLYDDVTELYKYKNSLIQPIPDPASELKRILTQVLSDLQVLASLSNSTLADIAKQGCDKNLAYWSKFPGTPARSFDDGFPEYEKLPRQFVIDILSIEDG